MFLFHFYCPSNFHTYLFQLLLKNLPLLFDHKFQYWIPSCLTGIFLENVKENIFCYKRNQRENWRTNEKFGPRGDGCFINVGRLRERRTIFSRSWLSYVYPPSSFVAESLLFISCLVILFFFIFFFRIDQNNQISKNT